MFVKYAISMCMIGGEMGWVGWGWEGVESMTGGKRERQTLEVRATVAPAPGTGSRRREQLLSRPAAPVAPVAPARFLSGKFSTLRARVQAPSFYSSIPIYPAFFSAHAGHCALV
jgi:hypothetical protein